MASSASNRKQAAVDSIIPCWFKTTIHPHKEEISICRKFLGWYSRKIRFFTHAWIKKEKKQIMCFFKSKNGKPFISSGVMVGKIFKFEVPTTVYLFYQGNNEFIMFDELPTISDPPPVAPRTRYPNGWTHAPNSHFKALIDLNEARIGMCYYFVNNFSRSLDFSKPGWLIDGNKDRNMVKFEYVDKTWCMRDGRTIARKYGYTKPTFVYLYYRLEKNEFLLFDRVFHKIIQNSNRIRREIERAEESNNSDADQTHEDEEEEVAVADEDEDTEGSDENGDDDENEVVEVDQTNYHEFEVTVTDALANTKQVFATFPKQNIEACFAGWSTTN